MLWVRTKLGGGQREVLLPSPPGSQASTAFVSQIILSVRRQTFPWHCHMPGWLPAEAQHCAELRWCSESCRGAGSHHQKPTRAGGQGCAGGKQCVVTWVQRRTAPGLGFFFCLLIFRAESSNHLCSRVSANHPDELRRKDLFLP